MRSRRAALALLFVLLLGSVASTCQLADQTPADTSYDEQSAEGQTEDEQQEEVDEQINE